MKEKIKQSFFSEAWQITWSQLCHGKPPYGSSSDDRLTVLVFWPLFLGTFLFVALFVAIRRLLTKEGKPAPSKLKMVLVYLFVIFILVPIVAFFIAFLIQ